jgi:hypothetical protein
MHGDEVGFYRGLVLASFTSLVKGHSLKTPVSFSSQEPIVGYFLDRDLVLTHLHSQRKERLYYCIPPPSKDTPLHLRDKGDARACPYEAPGHFFPKRKT